MNFEEYYEKFEMMQGFVVGDLRKSTIKGTANFLVAMGLFNYIEMLGAFYFPESEFTKATRGIPEKRFNYVFETFLPQPYKQVLKDLKRITRKGAYDCLRCGMAHEYFIKSYKVKNAPIEIAYTIYGVNEDDEAGYMENVVSKDCGIEIISLDKNKYHLRIYNPRFIHDLNGAFETFKSFIRSSKSYRDKFLKRCQEIHLENFN